ncbi:MAG TPA: DNA starvation/stationary phase protection protein [Acidimicrobiales bacterium]|nr:DNA starvation/stationary phase protection protein [Acidimicrobiales bacterium]
MSTTATPSAVRRSPLDPVDRDRVAAALQPVLVDLVDLSLAAKQAHWTVVGERFRTLHLELDELTTAVRLDVDAVAERLAAVGVVPDGRAVAVAAGSSLDGLPAEWIDGERMVTLVADEVAAVVAKVREALRSLGGIDVVTDDLLTGVLGRLEAQLWMLAAQER